MAAHDEELKKAPWEEAHDAACRRGDLVYRDPETGKPVFTRLKLLRRGFCCQSGCRHCPWEYGKDRD